MVDKVRMTTLANRPATNGDVIAAIQINDFRRSHRDATAVLKKQTAQLEAIEKELAGEHTRDSVEALRERRLALACGPMPGGRVRITARLADQMNPRLKKIADGAVAAFHAYDAARSAKEETFDRVNSAFLSAIAAVVSSAPTLRASSRSATRGAAGASRFPSTTMERPVG